MTSSIRVLSVGHVALDLLFYVDEFPEEPTKITARDFIQTVGGMSGNAAVAAARLGAQVRFAGPVGDDFAADLFVQHFERERVDIKLLHRVSGELSSISAIVIDGQGERVIVNRRATVLSDPPAFDSRWLENTDVLLTDPRCPSWCVAALIEARQRGVLSVFDGDIAPIDDLRMAVPMAEWAVFSEAGLQLFAPGGQSVEMGLRTALLSGARAAAVTHGERGVWWLRSGGSLQHCPARPIARANDTTGAGDVFHAALGVALAEGQTDQDAMQFACHAASFKCERPGGILGAPTRAELLEILQPVNTLK